MKRISRLVTTATAIFLVAAGLLVWPFWPSKPAIPGAERVRQYTNVRAWAGMQGASSSSRAMVSYLPVPPPGGKAAAVSYLASLVQRQCAVIVAVGQAQAAAATSEAARYRDVRFIVIARGRVGAAGRATSGVIRISAGPAAQVRSAVEAAVSAAVNG
jgi:hypothetical protein